MFDTALKIMEIEDIVGSLSVELDEVLHVLAKAPKASILPSKFVQAQEIERNIIEAAQELAILKEKAEILQS